MEALRLIQRVSKDGYLENVKVPNEMGEKVELIILPAPESSEIESYPFMEIQEKSGFVKSVLAASGEDVWNDI